MHGGTQETGNPGNQQTGRGTAAATAASAAAAETAAETAAAADCKCYLRGAMIMILRVGAAARGSGSGAAGAAISIGAARAAESRVAGPHGRQNCKNDGIAKSLRVGWLVGWLVGGSW